jgi:hypothetical protein
MYLPEGPDLLIERDIHRVIRELRHLQTPAESEPGDSPRQAAIEYLRLAKDRELLPVKQSDLDYLIETIESDEPTRSNKARFRWSQHRELARNGRIETTIVWCQQTVPVKNSSVVIDLQGSSIRLVMHHVQETNRLRITSARLTTLNDADLSVDVPRAFVDLEPEWADELPLDLAVELLGPVLGFHGRTVEFVDQRLVAYHRRERRTVERDSEVGLAISATVFMPMAGGDSIAHRVLFDPTTDTLIRKAPIASACAGYAFLNDPASKTGGFRLRPDSCAASLDQQRDPVALDDLDHAGGGRRALSGPRVKVRNPAALGQQYDPPKQMPPFAFSSRSNEFAAVSAYYHCDSMMQLIEGFGFSLADHFRNVVLPLTVEHRAKLLSGPGARDGRGINAYVTPFLAGAAQRPWNVKMLFGLADYADTWKYPLGLAADVRFVWHEFCHVLILAATGSTEFDFAHSAGDALAAIMDDPSSKLPVSCRGVTFPFVSLPMRRHDRDVKEGWGWNGTLYEKPNPTYGLRDPAGYNAEQILSSTLFRLYCAAGGDAGALEPDVESRRAAAYYTAYLIVRAIASLGCIDTEPTREAGQLATALMEADIGTPDLDYEGSRRLGGMLHKVVRWTFEKQGLYQTSPHGRQNKPGSPPPIDIYVDDGRAGEYGYRPDWSALPDVVWVRRNADGLPGDEAPYPGQLNYVYIALRNRGAQPAVAASIDVFAAVGAAADQWDTAPDHWQRLQGDNTTLDVPPVPGQSVQFGPFKWTPEAGTRNALLVRATVAGDRSNIDTGSNLPCAIGPVAVADLVRTDNNLGYREWTLPYRPAK